MAAASPNKNNMATISTTTSSNSSLGVNSKTKNSNKKNTATIKTTTSSGSSVLVNSKAEDPNNMATIKTTSSYSPVVVVNSVAENSNQPKMNALQIDQAILDIFTMLAVAPKEQRIGLVENLINKLKEKQDGKTEVCGELLYTLKRLIKGLSSTRKWVRVGYPLAFCQVLRQFPHVKLEEILKMVEEYLDPSNADSLPEKSNFEVGKGYALSCIIQSECIFQDKKEIPHLLEKLVQFKSEKAYVKSIWDQNLPLLVRKVLQSEDFDENVWPTIEKDLSCGWDNASPERLEVLLLCKQQFPEKIDKSFLKKHWKSKNLIDSKTHENLLSILKDSLRGHPLIHNVNKLLVEEIVRTGKIDEFWKEIGEKLILEDSHKKRLGMFLLSEILKSVTETNQLKILLSPKVCEMLFMDFRLSEKNMSSAQIVIDSLVILLDKVRDFSLHQSLLESLLTPVSVIQTNNAELSFFLANLLPHLIAEVVELFGKEIMSAVQGKELFGNKMDTENLFLHKWLVGQLLHLLHHPGEVEEMAKWQGTILEFLFRHSFFTLLKPSETLPHCEGIGPDFPVELVEHCQNLFPKCFLKVITQKTDKTKKKAIMIAAHQLFSYVELLIKNTDIVKPLKDLDDETIDALVKTKKMMKKLEAKKNPEEDKKDINAFELLLIYLALQLFCDPQNSLEVIQDTLSCCNRALRKTKKAIKDEPDWMQVLLEVLIGMLANPTKLSRVIALNIFSAVIERIKPENVTQITDILTKKPTNLNEDEDLYFEEDGEGGEEEVVEDEEEEEEDAASNGEESSSEEEEEEEEEEEDESMEVDEEFRQKIKTALGDAVVGSDEESDDLPDLTDEEMIERDKALVAAFRSMNKTRINKTEQDKKQQLVTLKIRLLDMIGEILKHPQPAEILLNLHMPLLDLQESSLRNKDEKVLCNKVSSLYQQLCKSKVQSESVPALSVDELQNTIQSLVTFSRQASTVGLIISVSEGILSLIKMLNIQQNDLASKDSGKVSKAVFEVLLPSLNNFLENQGYHHHFEFFKNLFEKQIVVFWSQNQFLLDIISDDNQKIMKRTKACGLLLSMVNKNTRQVVNDSDWKIFSSAFVPAVVKLLDSSEGKVKFLEQVLRLFNSFMTIDKGHNIKLVPVSLFSQLQKIKKSSSQDNRKLTKSIAQQLRHHGLKPPT